ncbi:MAG: PaaI family thioesterase [Bacteroidales bacterium]|jgi:uncharacterized protein (TIGR00369 family)|nr:PaaI family thioesterase [Bacteroidales bacterium]
MKKIYNPYREIEGYNCFGCSQTNPIGLKLDFFETDEGVLAKWIPTPDYEGYHNVLHGGIQATILDEVGNWILPIKIGSAGVTRKMDVHYLESVYISHGELTIKAKLIEMTKNIAHVEVWIEDVDGRVKSKAFVEYFVFPEEIARKKFYFPGKEKFRKE